MTEQTPRSWSATTMDSRMAEKALRERLARLAHAPVLLADASTGSAPALHTAIASAIALPIVGARGAFFLAQRGSILEYGCDDRGELIERSMPSALDLVPWSTGGADGHAPFGYVRAPWCTIHVKAADVLVGGAILYDLPVVPDEGLRAEIEAIAAHAGALLRMRAALEESERLAVTDVLTGAKTRQAFMDALQRACDARDNPYVVVFLDFDGFKQINDTQGHEAGDKILQLGARTLMNTVRSDEMVARLGGDEFVALVRADHADSKLIALRLTAALEAVGIAASAGAARAIDDAATSLRLADESMYAAKAARKSRARLTVVDSAR